VTSRSPLAPELVVRAARVLPFLAQIDDDIDQAMPFTTVDAWVGQIRKTINQRRIEMFADIGDYS